jgi:hypothetical protein
VCTAAAKADPLFRNGSHHEDPESFPLSLPVAYRGVSGGVEAFGRERKWADIGVLVAVNLPDF